MSDANSSEREAFEVWAPAPQGEIRFASEPLLSDEPGFCTGEITERDDFEDWAVSKGYSIERREIGSPYYLSEATKFAWKAWKHEY